MFTRTRINLLLVVFFFGLWGANAQQTIVEPLDTAVALAGKIREIHGYGPPGYGENKKTDTRITYWILDLPTIVNSLCTPERPEWQSVDCKATKQLRLFFPTSPTNNGLELKAKALMGHRVIVTGILHRQDTLGEITPIYMDVTEVKPVHPPQSF